MKTSTRKLSLTYFLLIAFSIPLLAQKLPNIQIVGLRPPAGLKIDGKIGEWGDGLQAFNKNVMLYYSLANDDENLYLVVHSSYPTITRKIMNGGMTFKVYGTGRKEKEAVSITFPAIDSKDRAMIRQNLPLEAKAQLSNNEDGKAFLRRRDSAMFLANRRVIDKLRNIEILGVDAIADKVISIYNDEGIKARALFDIDKSYNYELAIPLKYLSRQINTSIDGFEYQIRLTGLKNIPPIKSQLDNPPPPMSPDGIDLRTVDAVTDFTATYKLKK